MMGVPVYPKLHLLLIRTLLILTAYVLVLAMGFLGLATYQANLTGWFLILTAVGYGLGGPFLLRSNLRKSGVKLQENRGLSFWLIIPGFLIAYYASPLEYLYLKEFLFNSRSEWMQIIGAGLIVVSLLLFVWVRMALKDMYSGRLQVKVGHTLIKGGPYRIIRHPAYAAYILMCLGIAIGYSSLIGLLGVPSLLIPGFIYRMNVEEKILISEFGDEYVSYSHTTKRLIPGIW